MSNNIFKDTISLISNGIYQVANLKKGNYDTLAIQYDRLISNPIYNKLMWGNSVNDYSAFCNRGLESNKGGPIVDIGCGTLSFTYKSYVRNTQKKFFLCDLSLEMLQLGKRRIDKSLENNADITFIRADALKLPFKDNSIETALLFGIFHIFDEPDKLIQETMRILQPGGKIFLSSLCNDRKLSSAYLNLLQKKNHVASPKNSTEIRKIIESNEIIIDDLNVKGGMTYIFGHKK